MKITNRLAELENKSWEKIIKNPNIIRSLLAPNERLKLLSRLAVIELMASGKSHREISRELDISRQTINAIKKSLETREYKSYRQWGKTKRKKKIYSPTGKEKKARPEGRMIRTKYGTIYSKYL